MNYYYFAATLPMLSLDTPPPLSLDQFRARCSEFLAPADSAALADVLDPARPTDAAFVKAWRARDAELRNAIARHRATRRRVDPAPHLRETPDYDLRIEKAVFDALIKPTPIERELALDRLRWELADELAGHNAFSERAILAYGLKLQMVERWAAADSAEVLQSFQHIVASAERGVAEVH